jgi:hypothetical protein
MSASILVQTPAAQAEFGRLAAKDAGDSPGAQPALTSSVL